MNFIDASTVFDLMNSYLGRDYLFGIDFELKRGFFVTDPLQRTDIQWRVGDYSNFTGSDASCGGTHFEEKPIQIEEFFPMFDVVRNNLLHGNSFLTNLTIKTPLITDYSLSEIAMRCNSPYLIMVPERFVCFSPETFIRIDKDKTISCYPMKGTIAADHPNALQALLDDPKEAAEHYTIVDLMRNDLSIVADGVAVERFRYPDLLTTSGGGIFQTSSLIKGTLTDEYSDKMGDVLFSLLPAGSVSGAPKPSTLNVIREVEKISRGFYCGVFGYCDGQSIDAAVMIRFIEQDEHGKKYFRSGSGITANSDATAEYNEIIKKIYLPFTPQ